MALVVFIYIVIANIIIEKYVRSTFGEFISKNVRTMHVTQNHMQCTHLVVHKIIYTRQPLDTRYLQVWIIILDCTKIELENKTRQDNFEKRYF